MGKSFCITRLWRFLNIYFLKPFDAVNDTLTAHLLWQCKWEGPFIEIGCGDGVFSYIMHGGRFPYWFDRYLDTALGKQDIFDTTSFFIKGKRKLNKPFFLSGFDRKFSHALKAYRIGFSGSSVVCEYERLPLKTESVENIFYYIPHGLKSHSAAVAEACRSLKKKGRMIVLVYDSAFREAFLNYRIGKKLKNIYLKRFFTKMDNGRFDELSRLSRTEREWREFFEKNGLRLRSRRNGLSVFAWRWYDIQTRPILVPLIRIFNYLPLFLRTLIKFFWMLLFFPFLLLFYLLFSNDYLRMSGKNCFFVFEFEKAI